VATVTDAVELVLDARARIGEGPWWDARSAVLVWVDIERGELHLFDPRAGRDTCFTVGGKLGAAVPRAGGGYVLALDDGFYTYTPGGRKELVAPIEAGNPRTRLNDARCDPSGRIWGGSLDEDDLTPRCCGLYSVDNDAMVHRVLDGVTISNGLDWSPDGTTLYYVDSRAYAVQSFDFDVECGTIGNARRLVEYAPEPWVFPDGLTVDAEGFLWVAIFGAGVVHRYAPDGTLERIVEVPARLVTSCGFGGPDLDELYITSATHLLKPGEASRQPHAGGLFRHRPGVSGRPQHAFRG
jgi:sugar lactone lactonase YvrE